ncbi:hypothetical protein V6N13_012715 [Hibiscus sabdariffa]
MACFLDLPWRSGMEIPFKFKLSTKPDTMLPFTGVWLMHCHLDVHINWGLAMAFLVENGVGELQSLPPPPPDLPLFPHILEKPASMAALSPTRIAIASARRLCCSEQL